MYSVIARNVNKAFVEGLLTIAAEGIEEPSRNGKVLVLEGPMLTTYQRPTERVLFDPVRDANPYFHLMEAIWMLAGRKDAAWPTKFNSRMAEYANLEGTYDGAYGHRWRNHFNVDQIDHVVGMLAKDPNTRRAVITMFDPMTDFYEKSKDIPCNTTIYFRTRGKKLDMTVCNRSNDAVWGAYGANVVHMSMLLELVAAGAMLEVGRYHQFSNNFHLYLDHHEPLLEYVGQNYDEYKVLIDDPYRAKGWNSFPICNNYYKWLKEAGQFLNEPGAPRPYANHFFYFVARPMYLSWEAHKAGDRDLAIHWAGQIEDLAWAHACEQWLTRRYSK